MLRTQAKTCVPKVKELLQEHALLQGVERLVFCALPRTRLTWVAFEPLDDEDLEALIEDSRPLLRDLARALHTDVWFVGNNDYSGNEFASFDGEGKRRWRASDPLEWEGEAGERLERAMKETKTDAEGRAAEKQWAAWREEARAKSPWGRLETEAGLRWEKSIDLFGEAKRATWRKTVFYGDRPAPPPKKTKEPLRLEHRVTSEPPGAAVWAGEQFLTNTPCTLRLPATERCTLRLELPAHEAQRVELSSGAQLDVRLKPLAPLGTVRFQVSEGTGVWIDDALVCRGPCELPVKAGVPHRMAVEVSGFRHLATTFKVAKGKVVRMRIDISMEKGLRLVPL